MPLPTRPEVSEVTWRPVPPVLVASTRATRDGVVGCPSGGALSAPGRELAVLTAACHPPRGRCCPDHHSPRPGETAAAASACRPPSLPQRRRGWHRPVRR